MAENNRAAFSPAPEQPCNSWLIEMAQARAGNKEIPFATALSQIKQENPPLSEAARMEAMGGESQGHGPKFLQLMRKAVAVAKAKGLDIEPAMEQIAAANPDLARAARDERGGGLYAGELQVPPGIGDKRVLASEGVEAALDPSAHLAMLAENRCRDKGISYVEALVEVGREHPLLVRAAREQTTGRKLY